MWKVSVATRWPLTKIPNEPESTIGLTAFALSFLSAACAPAEATRVHPKTKASARRIPVSNFTRLLLVPCVARFFSGRAYPQFPRRSFPPRGSRFESSMTPSSSLGYAPHGACETVPGCVAADALLRFRGPAHYIAPTNLRPERPEKPWTHPTA